MLNAVRNVLVVDDDHEMRALLRDVLEQHGYTVTLASNGQEALASLQDREFPVVLTDLRMKGMQGIELLTQIKQSWADTNVISILVGLFATRRINSNTSRIGLLFPRI